MRKAQIVLALFVVLLFGTVLASAEDNAILALYNGKVVTFGDVKAIYEFQVYSRHLRLKQKFAPNPVPAKDREEFEKQCSEILASLTRMKVFNGLVKLAGIEAGMLPIEEAKENQIKYSVNQILKNDQQVQNWASFLKSIGLPISSIKDYIFEQELVKLLASSLIGAPDIISPKQIREYYEANKTTWQHKETVKIRLISLPFATYDGREKTSTLAQEIIAKVKKGEKFDELAIKYSKDSFAQKGGFFGELELSELSEVISTAIEGLKSGEIARPLATSSKIMLVFLEKRTPAGVSSLTEVRMEIKKILERKSLQAKQSEWIQKLYDTATVRYTHKGVKAVIDRWEKEKALKEANEKKEK